MTHLDEGTAVALRDGDLTDEGASEHLRECALCANVMGEASSRSAAIAEALASLDDPVEVHDAKAAVRRRLDAMRGDPRAPGRWRRGYLGRAAAILLLTAGAASALPWSPVRRWWAGTPIPSTSPEAVDGVAPPQGSPSAAISVAVPRGRITVIVRGARPGAVVDVVWVDRPSARVSAPAGSEFTYADGRAEVDVNAGPIRVELPRAARLASLEVDGRVFLERSGDQLDVPGPAVERSDAGVRFMIPTSR